MRQANFVEPLVATAQVSLLELVQTKETLETMPAVTPKQAGEALKVLLR